MKTTFSPKQFFKKITLVIAVTILSVSVNAQSGPGGGSSNGTGLKFDNFQLTSGTDLQVGAKYIFQNVDNNVDAEISIDSLVNGAKINKIDDNSNGTGYKEAFQPAVQSGGVIGAVIRSIHCKVFSAWIYNPGNNSNCKCNRT
ncbi:MAG: hypothetical protein V9F01_16795 [Chitinophagaceae bacterium]